MKKQSTTSGRRPRNTAAYPNELTHEAPEPIPGGFMQRPKRTFAGGTMVDKRKKKVTQEDAARALLSRLKRSH